MTSAKVTWKPPVAEDNVDGELATYIIEGKPPGSIFEAGSTHIIKYGATDSAGNDANSVVFTVSVKGKMLYKMKL